MSGAPVFDDHNPVRGAPVFDDRLHQLNNLRLMTHIREAKVGNRVVIAGSVNTKPGQQIEKCLTLVERSLIRYFLSEGDDLVNVQGTLLRRHEIESTHTPKWLVPRTMYIDRDR